MVSSVTKDAIGLVTVMDDQRHNLVTGDVVTFNSIQGMTEVIILGAWLVCPRALLLYDCATMPVLLLLWLSLFFATEGVRVRGSS